MKRPRLAGPRTENLKTQLVTGLKREPIAKPSKRDQTLEFMISVGAAPGDAQSQIDLGRGAKPSHRA
jgi:hypothetical protein